MQDRRDVTGPGQPTKRLLGSRPTSGRTRTKSTASSVGRSCGRTWSRRDYDRGRASHATCSVTLDRSVRGGGEVIEPMVSSQQSAVISAIQSRRPGYGVLGSCPTSGRTQNHAPQSASLQSCTGPLGSTTALCTSRCTGTGKEGIVMPRVLPFQEHSSRGATL